MDLSSVGWAVDRRGNAAAGAGVPEVRAAGIVSVAVERVQGCSIGVAIRTDLIANAAARVVLPVVVLVAASVEADALRASPSESVRALSGKQFAGAISDVEPLVAAASRSLSCATKAQMMSSVAFGLGEFDFYLFKL